MKFQLLGWVRETRLSCHFSPDELPASLPPLLQGEFEVRRRSLIGYRKVRERKNWLSMIWWSKVEQREDGSLFGFLWY